MEREPIREDTFMFSSNEPSLDNPDYVIPKRLQETGHNVSVTIFESTEHPGRQLFSVQWHDIVSQVEASNIRSDPTFRKIQRDLRQGRPQNYPAMYERLLDRHHPLPTPQSQGD